MYEVELKDGRILSMNARDVQTFRPLIRAFMLAVPASPTSMPMARPRRTSPATRR
ncbi:MAG: hypothetical protein IPK07_22800 [Deltaproteobacteria bacterium]|nr:hypothetical protein [Deltaproteobacteria bacterium]